MNELNKNTDLRHPILKKNLACFFQSHTKKGLNYENLFFQVEEFIYNLKKCSILLIPISQHFPINSLL